MTLQRVASGFAKTLVPAALFHGARRTNFLMRTNFFVHSKLVARECRQARKSDRLLLQQAHCGFGGAIAKAFGIPALGS